MHSNFCIIIFRHILRLFYNYVHTYPINILATVCLRILLVVEIIMEPFVSVFAYQFG